MPRILEPKLNTENWGEGRATRLTPQDLLVSSVFLFLVIAFAMVVVMVVRISRQR